MTSRVIRAAAPRVLRAVDRFGAPLLDLVGDDLAHPGLIFQMGVQPEQIDLMTAIDGVSFDEAWPSRVVVQVGELARIRRRDTGVTLQSDPWPHRKLLAPGFRCDATTPNC